METEKKQIIKYLVGAFGLGWICQIAASVCMWNGSTAFYRPLLVAAMYMPLVSVLLAKIPLKGMGWKPRLKGNGRWLLASWLGIAVLAFAGALLYFVIFPERLDLTGTYLQMQLGEAGTAQLAAAGMSIQVYLAVQVISAVVFGSWINVLTAIGEEAGWRGALYPYLEKRFGGKKGDILGGIIWGIWHWPIMLLTGYEYGTDYIGAPVLGMLLFCVITTAMGIVFMKIYSRSGCIWLPALAHGAVNALGSIPLFFCQPDASYQLTVGPMMIGIIGGLPLILTAAVILLRKQNARNKF